MGHYQSQGLFQINKTLFLCLFFVQLNKIALLYHSQAIRYKSLPIDFGKT